MAVEFSDQLKQAMLGTLGEHVTQEAGETRLRFDSVHILRAKDQPGMLACEFHHLGKHLYTQYVPDALATGQTIVLDGISATMGMKLL